MKKKFLGIYFILFTLPIFSYAKKMADTEAWRPLYHFTALKNWINDPNGLVYVNGQYHLYYQYNPSGINWGNMNWGHAVSKDLVNWQHLPIAIPEKITSQNITSIFSGSAVWDVNNTSGFCNQGGCIVAIYTAHNNHIVNPVYTKEMQYVSYSNDNGMTFSDYPSNPVIDLNQADFRDPNVFWYAPKNEWRMVVALPEQHKVQFYGSKDIKNWNLLSEFGNQGALNYHWECPSLFSLPVEGFSQKTKWVLMVSSSNPSGQRGVQYFIGDFDGTTFRNDNPSTTKLFIDQGGYFYAPITWNNTPDDKKTMIGWMQPGFEATYPWRGQMSIPRDLSLRVTDEGIRLFQPPSTIISANLKNLSHYRYIHNDQRPLINSEWELNDKNFLAKNTYWLDVSFKIFDATNLGFHLIKKKDSTGKVIQQATIDYDTINKVLTVDNGAIGNGRQIQKINNIVPLNGELSLQILMDKSSLELFINNGQTVLTTYLFPDTTANGLSFYVKGGAVIGSSDYYDLS